MNLRALLCLLTLAAAGPAALAQAPQARTYEPGEFDRIVLDGVAQVRLTQGSREQVIVRGDQDVQDSVIVRLSRDNLVIRTEGSWKFWNAAKPEIDVQVKELHRLIISGASDVIAPGRFKTDELRIHISGSGLVRFDDLTAEELHFDVSGAGDGQLAGRAGDMRLNLSGKGKVVADQLRTANAMVNISGVGTAQIWVTDTLRINVSGVGTVEYWGAPQVRRSSSGLATINARGDKR